jgi:hypothetical protein
MMKIFSGLLLIVMVSCAHAPANTANETATEVQTPVTITHIAHDTMRDFIELNATSSFLLKSFVKANANGYLLHNNIRIGQLVNAHQSLFTIKTKEAESIGNAVNGLDSSFQFSGVSTIRAGSKGYITQLNHVHGDYVQDGEQLAVISDASSFVFLMDVPYELKPYVTINKQVNIMLPDGTSSSGFIFAIMPTVDPTAQTQTMSVKINSTQPLPENLIAKIKITRQEKLNAVTVPSSAILTGETQNEFWIMQAINDSTAVKVPVEKGMSAKDRIEILSPALHDSDKILLTGNYGLEDTAKIKITN